jgi:hypothetical protein
MQECRVRFENLLVALPLSLLFDGAASPEDQGLKNSSGAFGTK